MEENKKYTCPMHSEVVSNSPGKCPKCGMTLVPLENGHTDHEEMKMKNSSKAVQSHSAHHGHMVEDFKKRFFVSIAVTLPVLVLSPVIQGFLGLGDRLRFPGDMYVLFVLSLGIYLYGGWPFLKGMTDELKEKRPGMMTLIALAISVAFIYSSFVVFGLMGMIFFWETVTLIDIMLLGHWIEMRSVMGASKALEELAKLMPSDAHLVGNDGSVKDVPLGELKSGDRVLVKPGEKIPADGVVVKGITSVNEAMLTGESKPAGKKENDRVIGASVNGEGSIEVKVEKTGKDSYLSQVIELVKQAQESKSKTQDLANKAALWLTITAISVGGGTFFVWLFLLKMDLAFSLERMVTVMVITCPHALGLAVPLVVAVSTAIAAKNGFLIRDRAAFENARKIEAVVFDKTGTLTQGVFGITDKISFDGSYTADEMLKLAASVEANSEHSIAASIAGAATGGTYTVSDFTAIPGKGAKGRVNGKEVMVVSPGYALEKNMIFDGNKIESLKAGGKTVVLTVVDGKPIGAIALSDIVRPESKEAIDKLKKAGIKTIMLTGDNKIVAEKVSSELGMDEYFAEVLPHDKVRIIKEIQQRGLTVAMTGDGINDAPALAQADVGIAIGAGTDVAVETADIILVKSNPKDVVSLILLARATYKKMAQNLIWATGYNLFAIPLAAGVLYGFGILLSPAMGAVLMSVSTVIVAINARTLKIQHRQKRFERLKDG